MSKQIIFIQGIAFENIAKGAGIIDVGLVTIFSREFKWKTTYGRLQILSNMTLRSLSDDQTTLLGIISCCGLCEKPLPKSHTTQFPYSFMHQSARGVGNTQCKVLYINYVDGTRPVEVHVHDEVFTTMFFPTKSIDLCFCEFYIHGHWDYMWSQIRLPDSLVALRCV